MEDYLKRKVPNYESIDVNNYNAGVINAFKDIMVVVFIENLTVPKVEFGTNEISLSWEESDRKEIIIKPFEENQNDALIFWRKPNMRNQKPYYPPVPYFSNMEEYIKPKLKNVEFTNTSYAIY